MTDYADIRILLDIEAADREYHYSDRDGVAHKYSTSTDGRVVVENDIRLYKGVITNEGQIKEAVSTDLKGGSPSVGNINVTIFNEDNLHRDEYHRSIQSAQATIYFVLAESYDEVLAKFVGVIDTISWDYSTLSFQIRSEEISIFKKIPEAVLEDDTFQTQLVLFTPTINVTDPLPFRYPVQLNDAPIEEPIVSRVYHPSLAGHSANYWRGARVDVVNAEGSFGEPESDSFSIGEFAIVVRSDDNWIEFNTSIDRYFLYTFIDPNLRENNLDYKAYGSIICPLPGALSDNDNFQLDDGLHNETVFEYQVTGGFVPVAGRVAINITAAVTENDVAIATRNAVNGVTALNITAAVSTGSAVVDFTNDRSGSHGNQPIIESLASGTLNPEGMHGAPDNTYEARDCINNTMVNTAKIINNQELITNGDFSAGSSGWLVGAGWLVSGGAAAKLGTDLSTLRQDLSLKIAPNTMYTVKIRVWGLNGTTESCIVSFGGTSTTKTIIQDGTYTFDLYSGNGTFFTVAGGLVADSFKVDDISVAPKDDITMMITRRGVPENADSVGRPFPIVYGEIQKLWAVWSVSTKSTRQNSVSAGDDIYVIAGHKIYDQNPTEVRVWFGLDENAQGMNIKPGVIDFVPDPLPRSISEIDRWHENGYDLRSGNPSLDVSPLHKLIEIQTNKGDTVTAIKLRGDEYTGWYTNNAGSVIGSGMDPGDSPGINGQPQFPIRYGLGNSKVYVSFRGIVDYTGEITGSANSLIEHPVDIIKHFLLNYTNIDGDESKINEQSFADAKAKLPNWRFAVALTDVADGGEILSRLTSQCKASWIFSDGQFRIRILDLDDTNPTRFIDQHKHFSEKQRWSRPPLSAISNDFTFKYGYNQATEEFDHVIRRSKANDQLCRDSYSRYGAVRSHEEIEFLDINDAYTANQMADHVVALLSQNRITFETGLLLTDETYELQPGEVVQITYEDPDGTTAQTTFLTLSVTSKRTGLQAEFLELF